MMGIAVGAITSWFWSIVVPTEFSSLFFRWGIWTCSLLYNEPIPAKLSLIYPFLIISSISPRSYWSSNGRNDLINLLLELGMFRAPRKKSERKRPNAKKYLEEHPSQWGAITARWQYWSRMKSCCFDFWHVNYFQNKARHLLSGT